jgi:hypothetical protein
MPLHTLTCTAQWTLVPGNVGKVLAGVAAHNTTVIAVGTTGGTGEFICAAQHLKLCAQGRRLVH